MSVSMPVTLGGGGLPSDLLVARVGSPGGQSLTTWTFILWPFYLVFTPAGEQTWPRGGEVVP